MVSRCVLVVDLFDWFSLGGCLILVLCLRVCVCFGALCLWFDVWCLYFVLLFVVYLCFGFVICCR